MSASRNGQVITFYSYKGGTGRTMAMANVAWIIASSGKRVLVVDWDLESPGLHKFFEPFLEESKVGATPGVIELINDYANEALKGVPRPDDWYLEFARVERDAVSLEWDFPDGGKLRGDCDRLGQLLRAPWRRALFPRAARGYEAELRLRAH